MADENLNLKSRLTELEAKVLPEGQLNNIIGYKNSNDTVIINEVNPPSIDANSIPPNNIFQTPQSNEVNDNHSNGADDLSTQISQPVVINEVITPDVTRKPSSWNPKTVASKPNYCGVQIKNQNQPIPTRITRRCSPQFKRKFIQKCKKDVRIGQTYHVNSKAVSKVNHCGDQTKNQNQPIPTRITHRYPSRFKRKFNRGYKNDARTRQTDLVNNVNDNVMDNWGARGQKNFPGRSQNHRPPGWLHYLAFVKQISSGGSPFL